MYRQSTAGAPTTWAVNLVAVGNEYKVFQLTDTLGYRAYKVVRS
jgi:hypothetical protein